MDYLMTNGILTTQEEFSFFFGAGGGLGGGGVRVLWGKNKTHKNLYCNIKTN